MTGRSNSTLVHETLEGYAGRGVFRSFSAKKSVGRTEFRFLFVTPVPILLVLDAKRRTLSFRNLLPNVPARSSFYHELKQFIRSWSSAELPSHRRLDPRRGVVRYRNHNGSVSIIFTVRGDHHEYVTRRAVNLVSELFLSFLSMYHFSYMVRNFQLEDE